jgi:hypothetical protein
LAANIENHQTCFQVLLQRVDCCWTLVISAAEHSIADELRKDFRRPQEQCIHVLLSEQYFPPKEWAHLAIVVGRQSTQLSLKSSATQSNVEVFINGRSLASQKLAFPWSQQETTSTGTMHSYIGTLPFFRRQLALKWRLASLYLIEEQLGADKLRRIVELGPAYLGNLQTSLHGGTTTSPLVPEKKILLSLNAGSTIETNAQTLRSMMLSKMDAEMVTTLVGISPNDTSTPLRVLWNMATSAGRYRKTLAFLSSSIVY